MALLKAACFGFLVLSAISSVYAQGTSSEKPDAQAVPMSKVQPETGTRTSDVTILSDTQGVDFSQYLQRVVREVKTHWYNGIPEVARPPMMKRGELAIEFSILQDGSIAGMRIVNSSGDVTLDHAAWAGISGSAPFRPLPAKFSGKYISLRFKFSYNPPKPQFSTEAKILSDPQGVDFAPFLHTLATKIKTHWDEAKQTPEQLLKTSAVIQFVVKKDGSIQGQIITGSSGNAALDKTLLDAVKASERDVPLPAQFSGSSVNVSVKFDYNPD